MQAGEKDKEDNLVDAFGPHKTEAISNAELLPLKSVLAEKAASDALDGYGYYLYVYTKHVFKTAAECI